MRHSRKVQAPAYLRLEYLLALLYVLVLGFALIYAITEEVSPDQFDGVTGRMSALYLSMTVVSTVGMGDVHSKRVGGAAPGHRTDALRHRLPRHGGPGADVARRSRAGRTATRLIQPGGALLGWCAMSDYLELLPAVDIADGQAVQLVQGVAGSEKRFGDPVEAALQLAAPRGRVDPPRRPRRRVRARAQPRAARQDRRPPRHQGRDERRHPRRRVPGGRDGHRLPAREHRHRRARAAGVVRGGDRLARRPGGGRARRTRTEAGGARVDRGGRRPVRRPGPPRRGGLRALRRHRRQQGRHAPGPEPRPAAARCAPPPTGRSSRPAGSPS